MGCIKKVLAEMKLKEPVYYPNFNSVELAENFHIHWRNIRWQFVLSEWNALVNNVINGNFWWESMGKPYPYQGDPCIYLSQPWMRLPEEQFGGDRMAIELQEESPNNLPAIHFHYKNIRIDLSKEELNELIKLFKEAEKNL